MRWRRVLAACFGIVLAVGVVLRMADVHGAGWVIAVSAGALVFLFLLPIMGERSRQPPDAPERKVHWGD